MRVTAHAVLAGWLKVFEGVLQTILPQVIDEIFPLITKPLERSRRDSIQDKCCYQGDGAAEIGSNEQS